VTHPRISATVITLNEERNIAACLESLSWADEVIVIDSGSTDRTVSIAEDLGARVLHHAWEGFSVQKNYALSLATGDWVLHLDADERVTRELRDEISAAAAAEPDLDGYYMPRLNHWLGNPIRHSGWYPDYTLRLFRRGRARCEGLSHERFIVEGRTAYLRSPLLHFSYGSVKEHVVGILHPTTLDVEEAVRNGLRVYKVFPWHLLTPFFREVVWHRLDEMRLRMFFKTRVRNRVEILWLVPFIPLLRFFYSFVFRQGFRDGVPGFWIAVLSSYYEAVRLALLWERLRGPKHEVDGDALRRTSRM
jgi:glycosyltransferase involved in cell wall biosynthesis